MNDNKKGRHQASSAKKSNNGETKKKALKICGISVGCILAVGLILFGIGTSMVNADTVADGVFAGSVDLSDLTLSEAQEVLEEFTLAEPYEIILKNDNKSYAFTTENLDFDIDTEATAKKAYEYGKSGNIFSKISKAYSAKTKKVDILPAFIFDSTQISEKLNEFGIEVLGELKEHEIKIENDEIVITPGVTGYDNDPTQALEELELALLESADNEIEVSFNSKAPEELTLEKLSSVASSDGLDAAFKLENGEVVITEGRSGYTFDEEEAKEALLNVKEGGEDVKISCQPVKPKYTAADLRKKLFNAELGSYSTRYNAGQVNRSKNVAVAAGKLNNVIILPGETFSFNQTVGKRTEANGFKPAPEYQNGQSVMGIGGGTCQVSTTLYSAVLYANLEIVSRRNHSMTVSYVPFGQDATVTDSGTDFKFKNNTSFPVKLVTSAGKGVVTVKVIGTAPDPAVTVKIVNTKTGDMSATTTRIVYDKSGKELSSTVVAKSKYKPHASSGGSTATATDEASAEATPAPTEGTPQTQTPENTPVEAPQVSTPTPTESPKQPTPAPTEEATPTPAPVEPESAPQPQKQPEPVASAPAEPVVPASTPAPVPQKAPEVQAPAEPVAPEPPAAPIEPVAEQPAA